MAQSFKDIYLATPDKPMEMWAKLSSSWSQESDRFTT